MNSTYPSPSSPSTPTPLALSEAQELIHARRRALEASRETMAEQLTVAPEAITATTLSYGIERHDHELRFLNELAELLG